MKSVVAGIDIGGTNSAFGIVDKEGEFYGEGSIPTRAYSKFDDWAEAMHKAILEALAPHKSEVELIGIGIGAPNANYYSGCIENAVNLCWQGKIDVVTKLKELFGQHMTVVLTNDANAAAEGEMVYGGAKKMRDFIVITLGTGLGGGVVVNGQLVNGADGNAGELGHIVAIKDGRQCNCGRKGCLETYVSATGIKRTVFELLAKETAPSSLRSVSFDDLTSEMIYKAAVNNDAIALKAFEFTGKVLGESLADFTAFTTPEAFFLFGGLAKAGKYILEPTQRHMDANLLSFYRGKVKVLLSELNNKNAAVLGAAALVWLEQ